MFLSFFRILIVFKKRITDRHTQNYTNCSSSSALSLVKSNVSDTSFQNCFKGKYFINSKSMLVKVMYFPKF